VIKTALITISHRPALAKYHKVLLSLTGGSDGKYEYEALWEGKKSSATDLFNSELEKLESRLRQVGECKKRLAQINKELKLTS
jgi:hypothetical protein